MQRVSVGNALAFIHVSEPLSPPLGCRARHLGYQLSTRDQGFHVRGELDERVFDRFKIELRQDHHLVAFPGDGEEPQ